MSLWYRLLHLRRMEEQIDKGVLFHLDRHTPI